MATEKKTATKPTKSADKAPVAKKAAQPAASTEAKAAAPVKTGINHRKEAVGVVVSDKMQKTIVVKIDRRIRHTLYKKYVTRTQRFKAHDENNDAKIGDLVSIVESRPLSRQKRWALQKIIRRAEVTVEANV